MINTAKGLEYDNVQVLDDFIELNAGQKKETKNSKFQPASQALNTDSGFEFKLPGFGDELNLWYVAVTRAKKTVALPSKFWNLIYLILDVLEAKEDDEEFAIDMGKDNKPWHLPEILKAKKLFRTMDADSIEQILKYREPAIENEFCASDDGAQCSTVHA
jgi:superfamily I DNA/RNA helicase